MSLFHLEDAKAAWRLIKHNLTSLNDDKNSTFEIDVTYFYLKSRPGINVNY